MHEQSHPNDVDRSDVDSRLVGALAIGVALFLAGAPLLIVAIYPDAARLGRIPADLPQPPAPRLQVAPNADLARLRAAEAERLNAYGWIDRGNGIAHIPIERAMQLLADRGLTGWPSAGGPPPSSQTSP